MTAPSEFIQTAEDSKRWIIQHEKETDELNKTVVNQSGQLLLINQNLKWINAGVMLILGGMASLIFKVFGS